jgi:hypothetical protein
MSVSHIGSSYEGFIGSGIALSSCADSGTGARGDITVFTIARASNTIMDYGVANGKILYESQDQYNQASTNVIVVQHVNDGEVFLDCALSSGSTTMEVLACTYRSTLGSLRWTIGNAFENNAASSIYGFLNTITPPTSDAFTVATVVFYDATGVDDTILSDGKYTIADSYKGIGVWMIVQGYSSSTSVIDGNPYFYVGLDKDLSNGKCVSFQETSVLPSKTIVIA